MRVNFQDGSCHQCQGELEIIDADDATMTVCCLNCGDSYVLEPDAFQDGGIHYWPHIMAEERER